MTHDEIVKYTDHLLAEFYKGCQKQLNKENRQVDIILSDGDFSTLQNMMCEAIINTQRQTINNACEWVEKNFRSDGYFSLYYLGGFPYTPKNIANHLRKAMEE
jgi:hypothetical protein